MRLTIIVATMACALALGPIAAQTRITGSVMSSTMLPLTGANILLLRAGDSSLVKGSATTKDGNFSFENVKAGEYLVMATNVGFTSVYLPIVRVTGNSVLMQLEAIKLNEETKELQAVNVQSRRPLLEQKIDRLVVNVKNSITSAGSSALDILERSPGVIVNRQANAITMSGKEGVTVMINGKVSYMPVTALIQMLEGINAGNIDRIELITSPPSSLDAQGNAGFINIVLLTNPNYGLNGSFSLSPGYGDGVITTNSINLNYRKNKMNLFGDYSVGIDKRKPYFKNYRRVIDQGIIKESETNTDRFPTRSTHNARIGIDYQWSRKTMIGLLLSGNINRYKMHESIFNQNFVNGLKDTLVDVYNEEINNWQHAKVNFNFQHTVRPGEMISFDADFLVYKNRQPFTYTNKYYDGGHQYLTTENVQTRKKTPINFWVAKFDYTKNFGNKFSLETGAKITYSTFDNDVSVERSTDNGPWQVDSLYTSLAKLKEDIAAAYLSFNINPNDVTNIKLGLRYEYTNSNLGTVLEKDLVDRHYGRLFPTFFISHKLSDIQTINFSYTRRINRPAFTDMAPFIFFFDPNTFFSGNAALQPSISDNFKTDFTYKKNLLSLSYSHDDNYIALFQSRIDPKTNKQVIFTDNLNYVKTVSFVVSAPINITNWWNLQNNITGVWQEAGLNNETGFLKVKQAHVNTRISQNFQISDSYSAELSGFYQTASIFGRYKVEPYGQLDAGIQKKFRSNNEKIRLSVNNIFSSLKWAWQTNTGNDNFSKTLLQFNKITVNVSYSRSFGRNTINAARNRSTGSAEESQRVRN